MIIAAVVAPMPPMLVSRLTDLVLLNGVRDFLVQALKPFAQGLEIFAGIAHAELMAGAVLTAQFSRRTRTCSKLRLLIGCPGSGLHRRRDR